MYELYHNHNECEDYSVSLTQIFFKNDKRFFRDSIELDVGMAG